jgi:hypothetical protein
MKDIDQIEIAAQLCGEHGPQQQIHAFRDCWMRARLYLKALHQAAIGCAERCSGDPEIQMEVMALLTIIGDTNIWATECEEQLKQLEKLVSKPDEEPLVH